MQRCPCCNARLKSDPQCPRCGADLAGALHCEQLAQTWMSVALQTLNAGQADIAVAALQRSLSFKQTPAARLFRDFLIQQQYRLLYDSIGQKQWPAARQAIARLQRLMGDNEALQRFVALVGHLAADCDDPPSSNHEPLPNE
ncbi:hypothetical protein [Methylomonas methanica]|uniref:Uncharacterized protein n=1 Tax=Methylomonas methanica (strain DSM 25384 / MC09) TaxID=857087 RepID=G0A781_METMM|nr:hypothetical protein [Methylomonas methanica]AEF99374.1 hypothetical protein Metme_0936 [Methylomonas methanica MC09]